VDENGEEISEKERIEKKSKKIIQLQKICFKYHPNLKELSVRNLSAVSSRYNLNQWFSKIEIEELIQLCERLSITVRKEYTKEFIVEMLISNFEEKKNEIENIQEISLYPTEKTIWNENETSILPKLNLQFLSFKDYLIRNFTLFRASSTYDLKMDIEDVIDRMKPRKNTSTKTTQFMGWHKLGLPLNDFRIISKNDNFVEASLNISLKNLKNDARREWEELKQHDILILVKIISKISFGAEPDQQLPFCERFGIKYIRGCEIVYQEDMDGLKYYGRNDSDLKLFGSERKLMIHMDKGQYDLDDQNGVEQSFNLIIKRNPKENNFKSILETIRTLIFESEINLPDWFNDLFLGYGDPQEAHFKNIETSLDDIPLNDSILNQNHLKDLFPKEFIKTPPPYELKNLKTEKIKIESYQESVKSFFSKNVKNEIQFTKKQMDAILSGMNHGLTLINGPPGTGKTDCAVQIISNIYSNFPNERTLIVTHSNYGLNDLFEKIMNRDINESHLLRLGHGESKLKGNSDFTKFGRMNFILQRRLDLLEIVKRMNENYAITCETSFYFFENIVSKEWKKFEDSISTSKDSKLLIEQFPFYNLFESSIFSTSKTFEENFKISKDCFSKIEKVFKELEEYRCFEVVRTNQDRGKFILTKLSKIIGMTCTHAALKRNDFIKEHFEYDNLIIEESSQILEIESFIPMLLQKDKKLKRIIMLGDVKQLPPIIQNQSIQHFSHMDQSLFQRLIRLNVPSIELDHQGRMRSELANLFRWNYKELKDLNQEMFNKVNEGFKFNYQFINVEDYANKGEIQPNPFYYQNLGEAEYIVSLYMYMRLIGYEKEKITILTTYNGQKHLIKDILKRRCENIPFLKSCKVSTVDKFQGQQNDFILLSLVRTKSIGHIRDVRRLIVSLSRARLGLYIFGRRELFQNCIELQPSFSLLFKNPTDELHLKEKKIKNIKEMGTFVYSLIEKKLKDYKPEDQDPASVEEEQEEEENDEMVEEFVPTGMDEEE
jgi:intron-binding protein aquarius